LRRRPAPTPVPYTPLFRSRHDHRGRGLVRLALPGEAGEGLDDADHRSEEADEGRVRSQRAEEREEALERRAPARDGAGHRVLDADRKSTRLNSSHVKISYA